MLSPGHERKGQDDENSPRPTPRTAPGRLGEVVPVPDETLIDKIRTLPPERLPKWKTSWTS
jgi:hypothetical protein